MANELVAVPFHGDVLEATQDEQGRIWVSLRRCCESLGIDVSTQYRRLKGSHWATMVEMTMVAQDGRERAVTMIDRDTLPTWLLTIKPGKVKPEVRDKLILYQKEASRFLGDYFADLIMGHRPPVQEPRLPAPATPPATVPVEWVASLFAQIGRPQRQRVKLRPVREVVRCIYWEACPAERLKQIVNEFADEYWKLFDHFPPSLGKQVACARRHYRILEPIVNRHYEEWQEEKRQKELPFPLPTATPTANEITHEAPLPQLTVTINAAGFQQTP